LAPHLAFLIQRRTEINGIDKRQSLKTSGIGRAAGYTSRGLYHFSLAYPLQIMPRASLDLVELLGDGVMA
jgi:hypothetical protein